MTAQLDDFGKVALDKYTTIVASYNADVKKAKAVDSIDEFSENFMETDDSVAEVNAKIEKLESAVEDLKSQRLSIATPLIGPAYEAAVAGAGVDVTAMDEQLKLIRTTAKYLTAVYGDEVLKDTDKVESRKSSGGGTGTGGRRIRGFDIYIDGKFSFKENKDGVKKSTFSIAASDLGVETTELQRAFFDAAGMEDTKNDEFPALVEFTFQDHSIRVAKEQADESDDSE